MKRTIIMPINHGDKRQAEHAGAYPLEWYGQSIVLELDLNELSKARYAAVEKNPAARVAHLQNGVQVRVLNGQRLVELPEACKKTTKARVAVKKGTLKVTVVDRCFTLSLADQYHSLPTRQEALNILMQLVPANADASLNGLYRDPYTLSNLASALLGEAS